MNENIWKTSSKKHIEKNDMEIYRIVDDSLKKHIRYVGR